MCFVSLRAGILLSALAVMASPAGPSAIANVSLTPNAVTGGQPASGTVNLMAPAPQGGALVALAANNSAVNLPATVQVAQGQLAATFQVSTSPVASDSSVTITAAIGGSNATTTLTIAAPCVASLTAQLLITNGATGTGTMMGAIGLNGSAPSGGAVINLISGGGSVGKVMVQEGKQSEPINLNLADVTQIKDNTITAQTGSCAAVSATVKRDL